MNYIVDAVLVLLFVLCIIISEKKGFILAVADIASVAVGIIGGKYVSDIVALPVYNKLFGNTVRFYIESLFSDGVFSADVIKEKFISIFEFLPDNIYETLKSTDMFSVDKYDLSSIADAATLESKVIAPMMISFCKSIINIVVIILIIIAVRFITGVLCKHFLPKFIKMANNVAGGILGTVKGLLIVFVCANILNVISVLSKTLNGYVMQSYICSFVRENLNLLYFFQK